jgi:site-specific DNA recombinase
VFLTLEKIKVAAYCRVSTSTKDQLNSFENQQAYFQREIAKNPNMELVEIYADKGLSGTTISKRKEFLRMLYDAGVDWQIVKGKVLLLPSEREPNFKRILVSNTSRFARNILAIDALRELKKKGVYIDFLDSGKTSENEADEVFIQMLISFAEQESRDKSIKVRFGQNESALKGVIFTNKKIYGYKYIPEGNRLEIIPEEAEVIKTIFELYASGEGIRRIINILDEKGIRTRQGKRFAKSTISKILGQAKYCGDLIRNRLTRGEFLNNTTTHRVKPKEEWIIHENVIPPIISKELFKRVQELRDGKIHTKYQRGVNKGKSEYAGLIKCGKCGSSYIRNIDNGRPFYNCSLKKTRGTKYCNNVNVSEERINKAVEQIAKESLFNIITSKRDNNIILLKKLKEQLLSKIDKDTSAIVKQKMNEQEDILKKKERLLDLFTDGEFDKKVLIERTKKLDAELQLLENEIKELSKSNDEIFEEIKSIDKHIIELVNFKINKEFTKEEVLSQIKQVTVESNAFCYLEFKFKLVDTINRIIDKYIPMLGEEKLEHVFIVPIPNPPNYQPPAENIYLRHEGVTDEEIQKLIEQEMKKRSEEKEEILKEYNI